MSTAELINIQKLHEQWWKWIFSTKDGPGHPLKGNHGTMRAQNGEYLLAGQLPKQEEELQQPELLQPQRRQTEIPPGASVFIPIDNVLCTEREGDPTPLDSMCAKGDADGAEGNISARLDDQKLEPIRTQPHKFNLNVTELIQGTRKNKNGEPLGQTEAAADGFCALFKLPPFEGKSYHELEIRARKGIWVIYQIMPPIEKQ